MFVCPILILNIIFKKKIYNVEYKAKSKLPESRINSKNIAIMGVITRYWVYNTYSLVNPILRPFCT